MKVLIIGFGSIARKHVSAIRTMKQDCEFVALRSGKSGQSDDGINDILSIGEIDDFDFCIISNPTSNHLSSLKSILKFNKPVFLEKPPFAKLEEEEIELIAKVKKSQSYIYSAFNLRFLDALNYTKKHIKFELIQEVNVYCGSYLPDWRKGVDYRENYSAHEDKGGGVHLDLIHEIDYALWIFGKPKKVSSVKKNASHLKISAYDYAHYLFEYNHFCLSMTLNYFRREPKRILEIVTKDHTVKVDLINNNVYDTTNNVLLFESKQSVVDTYTEQMKYFFNQIKDKNDFSFEESIEALKIALL